MLAVKDIKRRKKIIENTMKITKAMELVAFSKLKKSKEKVNRVSPFFDEIDLVMNKLAQLNKNIDSVFFENKKIKRKCYIVIAGDKGLAGSYNSNLLKFVRDEIGRNNRKEDNLIVPIGKKSTDFFSKQKYNIYFKYNNISEDFNIDLAADISKNIIQGFIKNEFQELSLIFTDFISVLNQKVEMKKLLPLNFDGNKPVLKNDNTIYDPSAKQVLDIVARQYIIGVLYGAVIKSFASEQAARRIAMESASKNAKDMLKEIDIMLNKTRQSHITQEITEISVGVKGF